VTELAGVRQPLPGIARKRASDNGFVLLVCIHLRDERTSIHSEGTPMGKPSPQSALPGDTGWDIAFTRISRDVTPRVDACVRELTTRFLAVGLHCDLQSRHTPRGLSRFLSAVGRRGLLFIVDITLIDGMAVSGVRGAALDVRLLDACGDTVSHCSSRAESGAPVYRTDADGVMAASRLARSAISAFVMAMGHFDLVPTSRGETRQADH
jgi:hypothetical protein